MAWSVLILVSAGCEGPDSGDTPAISVADMVLVPVGGTVTVKGKPLAEAVVTFMPAHGPTLGHGETDSQGHYKLSCMGREGMPPGKYKVTVSYMVSAKGEPQSLAQRSAIAQGPGMLSAKEQLPPEYGDFGRTRLTAEVKPEGGRFDYDIPTDLPVVEKKPAEDKGADGAAPASKKGGPKAAGGPEPKPAGKAPEPRAAEPKKG